MSDPWGAPWSRGLPSSGALTVAGAGQWVTPDELLIITVRNALAGVALAFNGRLWVPPDKVVELNQPIVPTSDRSLNTFAQALDYGYLVSAAVIASSGAGRRGQTLAAMQLARPPKTAFAPKLFMGQDYVTGMNAVLWPSPRVVGGIEGPGALYSIAVTTPGAGADWTQTVPTGARWRIRGGTAQLVTSAAVATRQVALVIDDGVNTLFTSESASTQLAGVTQVYDLLPGGTVTTLVSTHQPLFQPVDLILSAGWRIRTSTGAIQAGDQWSAIRLLVEESLED